jgi:hypothetical protein
MLSRGIFRRALCLAAMAAFALPFASPAETCPTPELRTSGINYDPSQVNPGDLSTATLKFEATASILGQTIDIKSVACGSGCRKMMPLISVPPSGGQGGSGVTGGTGENVYNVYIVRFAKSGQVDQGGFAFDWLVRMEDCDGLEGALRVPANGQGQPVYPGHLSLSGRMVVSVRFQGTTEVMNLRSRKKPVLEGTVPNWPPYGMVLSLTNGPIPYFDERQIDDPAAQPVLLITSNTVTLGATESWFQKHAPEILSAEPVASGAGGLRLTWESTAGLTECAVGAYHVYRNPSPGHLDTWVLAASVPADQTSFVDTAYDGTPTEYSVVHATTFAFGFEYEGGLGPSVLVSGSASSLSALSGQHNPPLCCNLRRKP